MCGIAGVLGPAAAEAIEPMVEALRHRGPDGRGVYRAPGVALGAARLAIVAPGDGAQPMLDGELALVANAEIYNHDALRDELRAGGARFTTGCDVEVILHGYRAWGPDLVHRLRGFFAFALWDGGEKRMLVARDRFGIAPLMLWRGAQGAAFASEAKGLLALPALGRRMDPAALDHYLDQRHVGSARSLFAGLEPLPPGGRLLMDARGGGQVERWYRPVASGSGAAPAGGLDEAVGALERALDEATALRLCHGEAPVGLYVSGGLDSSMIASAAGRARPGAVAFSHGYDPSEDELAYAEQAAALSGGPWRPVRLGPEDLDALPAIAAAMEEPVANPDVIGLWALAREASREVKAVLCGEGADELFGSYPHQQLLDRAARHPRWASAAALALRLVPAELMRRLGPYPGALADPAGRARLATALTSPSLNARVEALTSLFDPAGRAALYTPDFAETLDSPPRAPRAPEPAPAALLDRLIDRDLTDWLPGYHLGRENRIAMAWGVEARYPFLDDAVVAAILPLARAFKVGLLPPVEKRLLRRLASRRLPPRLARRPKGPVRVPLALFGPRWPAMARDLLSPERVRRQGVFRPEAVARLLDRADREPFLAGRQVFALVLVELWREAFAV
ncbi:MAG: asparagine synthase (glutamine-hydrolyzing) [Deltaproteobacteria bacterium]|nr:asparagine synthase (glutamine-hydrolyzing) [Deltaproteobacteria bacterium]